MNIQNDREKLNYLIEKLLKNSESILNEKSKNLKPNVSIGAII